MIVTFLIRSPITPPPIGGGRGANKKGYRMATLLNILKNKNGMPYDYPLSHHQLLFTVLIIIYGTNMEIVFSKSKQNDIFTG